MITYEEFVKELPYFIKEADNLKHAARKDKDPNFRRWRQQLTELIKLIEGQDYNVSCTIQIRSFRPSLYVIALNDTIIELETIVEHYDKYDVPKKAERTNEANSIESGHIPTIKELFLSLRVHHGWKMFAAIIALLGFLLVIGFKGGMLYQKHFPVESEAVIKDESAK